MNTRFLFANNLLLLEAGARSSPTLGLKHSHLGTEMFPRWD